MTADPYQASAGGSDPGSWNRYAYVQGDPVNFNDPRGLAKCWAVGYLTDTVNHRTTVDIQCQSNAATQFDTATWTFNYEGDPSAIHDDIVKHAEKTLGASLDVLELQDLLFTGVLRGTARPDEQNQVPGFVRNR